jgi:hypothetical protein
MDQLDKALSLMLSSPEMWVHDDLVLLKSRAVVIYKNELLGIAYASPVRAFIIHQSIQVIIAKHESNEAKQNRSSQLFYLIEVMAHSIKEF